MCKSNLFVARVALPNRLHRHAILRPRWSRSSASTRRKKAARTLVSLLLGLRRHCAAAQTGGKSQSVQRHVAGVLDRCLAGLNACAGFVRVHKLHFIAFALFFRSVSQFPHLAKYSVEVSSHCLNFVVSNLCGSSSLLQSLHLYKLCFHVCFSAFLTRSGSLAQQAVHFAFCDIPVPSPHIEALGIKCLARYLFARDNTLHFCILYGRLHPASVACCFFYDILVPSLHIQALGIKWLAR